MCCFNSHVETLMKQRRMSQKTFHYITLRKCWPVIAALERRFLPKCLELRESQIPQLEGQLEELLRYLWTDNPNTYPGYCSVFRRTSRRILNPLFYCSNHDLYTAITPQTGSGSGFLKLFLCKQTMEEVARLGLANLLFLADTDMIGSGEVKPWRVNIGLAECRAT